MDSQEYAEQDTFEPKFASYTPPEVAAYGLEAVKSVHDNKDRALSIGIPGLQEYFAAVRPGQVAGVVGQTSHYKSGFLHYIEHSAARQIMENKREGEAIIHISAEEGIEEQAFLEFARYGKEDVGELANGNVKNWDELFSVSYMVSEVPIFRIGDSIKRSKHMQLMHISNIIKTVSFIENEFKVKPAMICIDYLQALPLDVEYKHREDDSQRRLQVRRDAYRIRQMSTMFNCPVWVACQAKQVLGAYSGDKGPTILIPGMYDINESADVAQRFDRLISTWLPSRSYPVGTILKIGNNAIEVTDDLLFIKVNKQRGGLPAGRVFMLEIEFATNTIRQRLA